MAGEQDTLLEGNLVVLAWLEQPKCTRGLPSVIMCLAPTQRVEAPETVMPMWAHLLGIDPSGADDQPGPGMSIYISDNNYLYFKHGDKVLESIQVTGDFVELAVAKGTAVVVLAYKAIGDSEENADYFDRLAESQAAARITVPVTHHRSKL